MGEDYDSGPMTAGLYLEDDASTPVSTIIVSRNGLATMTKAVAERGMIHDQFKTKPYHIPRSHSEDEGEDHGQKHFAIPTNIDRSTGASVNDLRSLLEDVIVEDGDFEIKYLSSDFFQSRSRAKQQSPSDHIISAWKSFTEHAGQIVQAADISHLSADLPRIYTVYGDLLLFPPSAFHSPLWQQYLTSPTLAPFFDDLASSTGTTHIALNAPIPLSKIQPEHNNEPPSQDPEENILRSPSSLIPLKGSLGPLLPLSHDPTPVDFKSAFWTSTVQNGITQIWAPRYTMFSSGNIKEKTRVLRSETLARAVREGREDGRGCAVVDLYVGIGYFAFSYLRVGVEMVMGWDLNGWSVEGCRRGAVENGFWVGVGDEVDEGEGGGQNGSAKIEDGRRSNARKGKITGELRLFCEDNTMATSRIAEMRRHRDIPPIRHVNCGLLPSSRQSWETAVKVLDKELGGWIHVHENFGVDEVEVKAEQVRKQLEQIVLSQGGVWPQGTVVGVDEVFRVKSYAPGVLHCVIDVHITPGKRSIKKF